MALLTQLRYSFEEFLSAEREAGIRHEYEADDKVDRFSRLHSVVAGELR